VSGVDVLAASTCRATYLYAGCDEAERDITHAGDVVRCRLKAIDWSDYEVALNAVERTNLVSIFPAGVCKWHGPACNSSHLEGAWRFF
jgi:hypothetical protein